MKKTNKNTTTNTGMFNHAKHILDSQIKLDKKAFNEFKKDPDNFWIGKYIFPLDIIREYKDVIDWRQVCSSQRLTEDFIREHKKYLKKKYEWFEICNNFSNLSENLIHDFARKIWWEYLDYSNLSEDFLERHIQFVDWNRLSQTKIVSEQFGKKYEDEINWTTYYKRHYNIWWDGLCIGGMLSDKEIKKLKKEAVIKCR